MVAGGVGGAVRVGGVESSEEGVGGIDAIGAIDAIDFCTRNLKPET